MKGLVLAGGKSSRMGTEKPLLHFEGLPLYMHAKEILAEFCDEVFISCSPENAHLFIDQNRLPDEQDFAKCGPISGLLSALNKHPGPWLVLGCDYPLITSEDIAYLIQKRNLQNIATVYYNQENKMPEPLIGIYEINILEKLSHWFLQGNDSLRVFLEQHQASYVISPRPENMKSIDTPEAYRKLIDNN